MALVLLLTVWYYWKLSKVYNHWCVLCQDHIPDCAQFVFLVSIIQSVICLHSSISSFLDESYSFHILMSEISLKKWITLYMLHTNLSYSRKHSQATLKQYDKPIFWQGMNWCLLCFVLSFCHTVFIFDYPWSWLANIFLRNICILKHYIFYQIDEPFYGYYLPCHKLLQSILSITREYLEFLFVFFFLLLLLFLLMYLGLNSWPCAYQASVWASDLNLQSRFLSFKIFSETNINWNKR